LGSEPWQTDGTVAGTEIAFDINTTTDSSRLNDFISVGDHVLFAAGEGGIRPENLISLGELAIFEATEPSTDN